MVKPQTSSQRKWLIIAVVLSLIFVLAGTIIFLNATTSEINDSYNYRYYDNPEAAIHILTNGNVTLPTTFF